MAAEPQTFLFMDLVGFTALTEDRGDDGAADVAIRFYARVRTLLPAHGAKEIKTIGDAMMVHCDDPALGIHLGLRIVEDLDGDSTFPPLRVGVHTGTAVHRDGDWYGGAVNVAARLCSAAGGGEVLVSETTGHAAGSLPCVELGERRLHWLKNVAEPVAARPAYKLEDSKPRAHLARLRKMIPRTGERLALRHSEVTG